MGAGQSKQTDNKQLGLQPNYFQGYPNMPDFQASPQNFQMQLQQQQGIFPQAFNDQTLQPPHRLIKNPEFQNNTTQQQGFFRQQPFVPEQQHQEAQFTNNFHNSHPKFLSENSPTYNRQNSENFNYLASSQTQYPNAVSPRGILQRYSELYFILN